MKYDVIVVGGGHAGIEACLSAARMGKKTLLITMLVEQIGAASCNPAIGGLAKGHLVRELDAIGGEMGLCTDASGLQFRILNASKGLPFKEAVLKLIWTNTESTCEKCVIIRPI